MSPLLLLAPGKRCQECRARPCERTRTGDRRRHCLICRLVFLYRARQAVEERLLSAVMGGPESANARHLELLGRAYPGKPYEDFKVRT